MPYVYVGYGEILLQFIHMGVVLSVNEESHRGISHIHFPEILHYVQDDRENALMDCLRLPFNFAFIQMFTHWNCA